LSKTFLKFEYEAISKSLLRCKQGAENRL